MTGVAIIGGGRWARVLASVLARIDTGPVTVCSPGNPAAWHDRRPGWRIAALADIWADPGISHVLIARRARDHSETVLAALAAGKSVLVEKPFCLTRAQADAILAIGGDCQTGLVFLHAPNQTRFRTSVLSVAQPRHLHLIWSDPVAEHRHGAAKIHDPALNVVQDVFPHVWSIIRPFSDTDPTLVATQIRQGGQQVDLTLQAGPLRAEVTMRRGHTARERHLSLSGPGLAASLDFTTEPGTASLNGAPLDVAIGHASPLEAEVRAFLHGPRHPLGAVSRAVQALDLTLAALALIRPQQAAAIRLGDAYALREVGLGGIPGDGTPASLPQVARWLGLADDDAPLNAAWTAAFGPDMTAANGR